VSFSQTGSPASQASSTLFISDVHLGSEPHESDRSTILRKFLATLRGDRVSDLYILGDLFDFWFEYRSAIFSANFRVLRTLAELRDRGVRLHYVVGNHDFWAGGFFESTLGSVVYREPVTTEMDGVKVFLCHGDGLNRHDYGYRFFKTVARWKPAVTLFRAIHPDVALKLGRAVSGLSRQLVNAETPGRLREAESIRQHALSRLRNDNVDVVVAGHCHIPTDESIEVAGKTKRYINLGDWLTHFTYAELAEGRFALKSFVPEPDA